MAENSAEPPYDPYPSLGFKLSTEQREALLAGVGSLNAALSDADTDCLVRELARDDGHAKAIRDFCQSSASVLDIARAEEFFDRLITSQQMVDVRRAFGSILPSRLAMQLLSWRGAAFTKLPQGERAQVLFEFCGSRLKPIRQLGQLLKRLAIVTMTDNPSGDRRNPLFDAIGYIGPAGYQAQAISRLPPNHDASELLTSAKLLPEHGADVLELVCDCIVVGSGVGGSVLAEAVSAAGYKVLMLEKAIGWSNAQLEMSESGAFASHYERGGLLFQTEDGDMVVAGGSALGGGSAVNWHCSLEPSHQVRSEWAKEYGVSWALGDGMTHALDVVKNKLAVHTEGVEHNAANAALLEGCRRLGYPSEVAPQQGYPATPDDGGLCGFGYKGGSRQGVKGSVLQDAAATGKFKYITQAYVDRVLVKDGKATGVVGKIAGKPFQVRARVVVSAAGSLHTPLLLRRSGLRNQHIGKNLRLHPVSMIRGVFDKQMSLWEGAPMTAISRVVEDQDGKGYGVKIEVPHLHPLLVAANLPFAGSAVDFKRRVLQLDRTMYLIALTRDTGSGSVVSDERGWPRVQYTLSKTDRRHMLQGLAHSARIMVAAGAKEIGWCDPNFAAYQTTPAGACDPGLEEYLSRLCLEGQPEKQGMFSAHQMGTCRMAATPKLGAIRPTGETWEVQDLFVSDTSTFPTPSGSNPMITCAAVAHTIALEVVQRLASAPSSRL